VQFTIQLNIHTVTYHIEFVSSAFFIIFCVFF